MIPITNNSINLRNIQGKSPLFAKDNESSSSSSESEDESNGQKGRGRGRSGRCGGRGGRGAEQKMRRKT